MNELALFAGGGGGLLASKLLGWKTVCAVEIEPFCREILMRRQDEGHLEAFPIWDDIRTFDGTIWRGKVDIVTGGFPCQDISSAGKGAGIEGARSGLWREMLRIIREVRPEYAFMENSPMLAVRGLGIVLGGLATLGYNAEWGVFSAGDVGARHERERIWIRAQLQVSNDTPGRSVSERPTVKAKKRFASAFGNCVVGALAGSANGWWSTEPELGRVAHGVADRLDRLGAIGNGQVPAVAALAFRTLMEVS